MAIRSSVEGYQTALEGTDAARRLVNRDITEVVDEIDALIKGDELLGGETGEEIAGKLRQVKTTLESVEANFEKFADAIEETAKKNGAMIANTVEDISVTADRFASIAEVIKSNQVK